MRLRSRGWHGGTAAADGARKLRACGLALLTRIKHKEYYLQSRPICRLPLPRDPRQTGSPPSPRAPPRPTARFIEDNTALCYIRRLHCHADCPGSPAGRATARGAAIIAPACRHPARQPLKLRLGSDWAGSMKSVWTRIQHRHKVKITKPKLKGRKDSTQFLVGNYYA